MNSNFLSPNIIQTGAFWVALFTVSNAVIIFFLTAQYVFELAPCKMCYWQRYPWYSLAVISGVLIFVSKPRYALSLLCISLLVAGGSIGLFHAGVEYGWWQGLSNCASNLPSTNSIEDLKSMLMSKDSVACDKALWTMLNISMAGYNALVSYALGIFLCWQFFSKAFFSKAKA